MVCLLTTVLDFQMKVETVEAALKHFRLKHGKSVKTDSELREFLSCYPADEAGNKEAAAQGLGLVEDCAMPANNQTLVWRRSRT